MLDSEVLRPSLIAATSFGPFQGDPSHHLTFRAQSTAPERLSTTLKKNRVRSQWWCTLYRAGVFRSVLVPVSTDRALSFPDSEPSQLGALLEHIVHIVLTRTPSYLAGEMKLLERLTAKNISRSSYHRPSLPRPFVAGFAWSQQRHDATAGTVAWKTWMTPRTTPRETSLPKPC